jgi:hypothetical protein
MAGSRPFQELNLRDKLGSHPNTSLHLPGSEALTPPAGIRFGKIDERAFRRSQVFDPFEDFPQVLSTPVGRQKLIWTSLRRNNP